MGGTTEIAYITVCSLVLTTGTLTEGNRRHTNGWGVRGLPDSFPVFGANHDHTVPPSASMSYLAALPVEALEKILLCLYGRDIVKMQAVWQIKSTSRRIVDLFSV